MGGLNAQIPLEAHVAPVQSPLQSVGQLMQMRNSLSEMALRQAQTETQRVQAQSIQAEAQIRQRELADQSTLRNSLMDPDHPEYAKAFAKGDLSFLNGKVDPVYQQKVTQAQLQQLQTGATLTKDQVANRIALHQEAGKTLASLAQEPDVDKRRSMYAGAKAQLQQFPGASGLNLPDSPDLSDAGLNQLSVLNDIGLEYHQEVANLQEAALKPKKTEQEIATGKATEEKAGAEAAHQQLVNKLIQSSGTTPASGSAHPIDQVFPSSLDPQINSSYKAAYDMAMRQPPDQNGRRPAADTIAEAAAQHAATIQQANNPQIRQGKVNEALAVEQATNPLKQAQAVAIARAMAGGQGTPLENVAAKDLPTVKAAYAKSGDALATGLTHAEEIQKVLDLAEAGNKAAGANAPLLGVGAVNAMNGIHRMNSAEIKQYGTAGSLLDKIQGKIQGWTEGKPIPVDVLEDMKALHRQLSEDAPRQHTREVQVLNKTYGSKLEPMDLGGAPSVRKIGDRVIYQGKEHSITAIAPDGKLTLSP